MIYEIRVIPIVLLVMQTSFSFVVVCLAVKDKRSRGLGLSVVVRVLSNIKFRIIRIVSKS